MFFIEILGTIYSNFLKLLSQLKLVLKYILNELTLLKFTFDSILFKKNNRSTSSLLEFFKKNCFFRDFIFLWQLKYSSDSKHTKVDSNHLRFFDPCVVDIDVRTTAHKPRFNSNILSYASTLSFFNFFTHPVKVYWVSFYQNFINTIALNLNKSFSFGFYYIQGFCFILFIDACLTDDEPLWEPIEWSLVQTWILFIFSFAWIAENLIVSRYGSYTGRDKRVWFSWYKTFWLIEGYYVINYGVACVFVVIPFYFELNYNLSFIYSWWHWYSRVFFFKFISIFTIILFISYYLQMTVRWLNWKKGLFLILLVNIFLSYLIFTQFFITFFGYFTDPVWYQKTRPIDYIQLSHEPARWGWGSAKKDHFTYHNVKTVFWFKNDGPFASAFLFCQVFLFICIFLLYIYWITLFRRVYAMKEIPLTFTTYCVSSLKQFFYFFLFFYIMIFLSYIVNYSRFPIEFLWTLDTQSWLTNFTHIVLDYSTFLLSIFFK